jgi:creatinine amidohydrolase
MFTLQRMQTFGFKLAVLFSGHFADTQLEMIDSIAANWSRRNAALKVFATAVNRIEGLEFAPDHAGIFETTLLAALRPDLVQLERLKSLSEAPLSPGENDFSDERHDPSHPIWGVFGPDPRRFKPEQAKPLLDACVTWLAAKVHKRLPGGRD